MEDTINISNKSHPSDVLLQLDLFRRNNQYCDFTIKCGRKEIQVHKCVIASASDYFRGMLRHNTKEIQTGVVEMVDVDPVCLEKCVEFMYTGEIIVSDEILVSMAHFAQMLHIHKLYDEIAGYMKRNFTIDIFCSTRTLASFYSLEKLVRACDEFAIDNFHAIMKMDWFKDLEAEYLMELLSSKDMNLLDMVKCKAIMIWTDSESNRAEWLFKFLKQVNMNNVPLSYRRFLLDKPIVFKSPKCLEYINNTMPEDNHNIKRTDYTGDCNPAIITVNEELCRLERYDLQKRMWVGMHPLVEYFFDNQTSVILVNRYLYLFDWTSYLLRIDFTDTEATWERLSTPLRGFGGPLVHLNGILYGCDQLIARQLGKYDISKNRWFQLPPKKYETTGSTIVVLSGMIFVIGGQLVSQFEYISHVECYNVECSSWSSPIGNLNVARAETAVCTHRNTIYVFGGHCDSDENSNRLSSVEILNCGSKCWELIKLDNLCRSSFLCHSLGGKIYLVGQGQEELSSEHHSVLVFDPVSISVSFGFTLQSIRPARHHYSAGVIM